MTLSDVSGTGIMGTTVALLGHVSPVLKKKINVHAQLQYACTLQGMAD